jgi:hypothetical protein
MGLGSSHHYNEDSGTVHHTDYNDEGRHSFDYDPQSGAITNDHSVSNDNQDVKTNWPDSNMWDD